MSSWYRIASRTPFREASSAIVKICLYLSFWLKCETIEGMSAITTGTCPSSLDGKWWRRNKETSVDKTSLTCLLKVVAGSGSWSRRLLTTSKMLFSGTPVPNNLRITSGSSRFCRFGGRLLEEAMIRKASIQLVSVFYDLLNPCCHLFWYCFIGVDFIPIIFCMVLIAWFWLHVFLLLWIESKKIHNLCVFSNVMICYFLFVSLEWVSLFCMVFDCMFFCLHVFCLQVLFFKNVYQYVDQ